MSSIELLLRFNLSGKNGTPLKLYSSGNLLLGEIGGLRSEAPPCKFTFSGGLLLSSLLL